MTPPPIPEFLSKDFRLQPGLKRKSLLRRICRAKNAPAAVSRTFTTKGNQVSLVRIHFSCPNQMENHQTLGPRLRGPATTLFISRDACSDRIAKLFGACVCGISHNYRAICCKMGYRTDVPVKLNTKGWGYRTILGSC